MQTSTAPALSVVPAPATLIDGVEHAPAGDTRRHPTPRDAAPRDLRRWTVRDEDSCGRKRAQHVATSAEQAMALQTALVERGATGVDVLGPWEAAK